MGTQALRLPGWMFLRVLRERRSLLYQMVRRDFTQRFVGSAAGWLWTLIHPLVILLSWVFAFQICMKMPPPPGVDNYTLYLFCGYMPWMLFQESVQRSANSLVEQAGLITKTVFPSEILPVSMFLSALLSHGMAMSLLLGAIFLINGTPWVTVLLVPVYTFFVGLFAIGASWIVASLQVFVRDTGQMVVVALTAWFWLTPIFIDEASFPAWARTFVHWNPLAHVVKAYRTLLLSGRVPPLWELAALAATALAMFVAGGLFFRYLKRGFADVL